MADKELPEVVPVGTQIDGPAKTMAEVRSAYRTIADEIAATGSEKHRAVMEYFAHLTTLTFTVS